MEHHIVITVFCLCVLTVWSEDSWLQEHAGATLNDKTDKSNDSEETGTKRPTEDTETVCSLLVI